MREDIFMALGCAVRIRSQDGSNFLVLPTHVYSILPDCIYISGKVGILCIDRDRIIVAGKTRDREVIDLDTDVCAMPVSEQECSGVGVSVSRIHQGLTDGSSELVRVVGPKNLGTVGACRPHPNAFGCFTFAGSTDHGTSGAAYLLGNSILAIHLSGGSDNLGYSLRLAYVTLLHCLKVKPEESIDWMEELVKTRTPVYVDQTWYDHDEVRIRVKGQYHVVERKHLAKIVDVNPKDVGGGWIEYRKPESAELYPNSQVASQPPTTSLRQGALEDPVTTMREMTAAVQSLTKSLTKDRQQQSKSTQKAKKHTAGPTQAAMPLPALTSS
uniref:Uncharacterized protein n=1 Tax=Riboviria sp. TaxID=2585031 RepID=A0A8K1U3B8_9VIRU|nr:MAG: hypothetical protein 1 [Riboviria sp.]